MSYCVHCGVKLADYHDTCPLCKTPVQNPNAPVDTTTRDYPNYRENPKDHGTRQIKKLLTGSILTLVFSMYVVILLLVNFIVNRTVSWSLIPSFSLIYLWFVVAFPFFRIKNTFFKLYSYDSIATSIYLLGLNYIISGNIIWAKFAAAGIMFIWIIMNGIIITDRVKKWIPIVIYYVLASLLFAALFAFMLTNPTAILHLVLPIYLVVLAFSLLSYFLITVRIFDIFSFFSIIFTNVSLVAIAIDFTISHYFTHTFTLGWSLIVASALIPLSLAALMLRNIKKLRSFFAKNFHR